MADNYWLVTPHCCQRPQLNILTQTGAQKRWRIAPSHHRQRETKEEEEEKEEGNGEGMFDLLSHNLGFHFRCLFD